MKFIGYVRSGPAAFRVGPVGQMEGIRFHLCASPLFHACAEGLAVADEFHVPPSFRLAAAIAPRRRKKSARRQFSPLGKAGCVLKPDADCGRGRLVPRFSPRESLSRIRRRQDGVRAADTLCGEHLRRLSSLETATVKSTARTNEKKRVRSLCVNT